MHKPPYKQMSKREAALHLDHRTADLDMYYEWRQSDEPVDVEFGGGHFISIRDMPDIRFSDMKYGQYANHVAHGRTEWEQHYEADLEDILEHDRIDRTKRREPRILVVYDEKPVRDTVQKAVMAAAPDGYSVTLVENVSGFVDSFYSGIDDALPALVIGTPFMRMHRMQEEAPLQAKTNLKQVCKRRQIPFIAYDCYSELDFQQNYTKIIMHKFWGARFGAARLQKMKDAERNMALELEKVSKKMRRMSRHLSRADFEHMARVFGVHYPTDHFLDRGTKKEFPYVMVDGRRIPIIAASSMVIKEGHMYLLMQEAKKGTGDVRKDFSKWTFPGGKLEEELPEEGALRELREETPFIGVVNGLLGVFTRINRNGKMIMKAAYLGDIIGEHTQPIATDSLGHGFFDTPTIDFLQQRRLLKSSDTLDIIAQANVDRMFRVFEADRRDAIIRLPDEE